MPTGTSFGALNYQVSSWGNLESIASIFFASYHTCHSLGYSAWCSIKPWILCFSSSVLFQNEEPEDMSYWWHMLPVWLLSAADVEKSYQNISFITGRDFERDINSLQCLAAKSIFGVYLPFWSRWVLPADAIDKQYIYPPPPPHKTTRSSLDYHSLWSRPPVKKRFVVCDVFGAWWISNDVLLLIVHVILSSVTRPVDHQINHFLFPLFFSAFSVLGNHRVPHIKILAPRRL